MGSEASSLGFHELFARIGVLGLEFSPRLAALEGRPVRMRGYLTSAHHGEGGLLVLTSSPVAACSSCGSDHDWPDDAVFVFPASPQQPWIPGRPTVVRGILDHGALDLPEAGVASLVRLRAATWQDE